MYTRGMTAMTTIKVPVATRDRIRAGAQDAHITQAQYLELALEAQFRAEIHAAMATYEYTDEERREMEEWDRADFGTVLG